MSDAVGVSLCPCLEQNYQEKAENCHWVKPNTVAEMAGASAIRGILELVQQVEFTASYSRKFNIKLGSL